MKCTIHTAREMNSTDTQYGQRWACSVIGCSVVAWGGSTSVPADFGTRQKRIEAHEAFDKIWKSGIRKRGEAYKALAVFLNIPHEDCHIGMFDKEQCDKVLEFAKVVVGW